MEDMAGGRFELLLLGVAVVIGLLHIVAAAVAGAQQNGRDLKYLAGPRDEDRPATSVIAGRLKRAQANFFETFPLFAAALLAAYLLGRVGPLTWWGSVLFVAARALYLPVYATGLPIRTPVWAVGVLGLVLVVVAVFTGG